MRQILQRLSTIFRAPWLRASRAGGLVETWLIMLALLLALNGFSQQLGAYPLANIVFFTSTAGGFWLALRVRRASGKPWRRVLLEEVVTGAELGWLASAGTMLPLWLVNRAEIFQINSFETGGSAFILGCSGLAYYAARAGVWLLSYWNHLRKRSLMWALTNALLTVVVLAAVTAIVLATAITMSADRMPEFYQQMAPVPRFLSRLMTTLLPSVSIFAVLTAIALAVLLPPLALFSFLFARQTTRRLQNIVQAAQSFRAGDYTARVPVEGQDEVSQLQSDFNGMAETLETTLQALQDEQKRVSDLLQSRRQLIAGVSHELRTPVATLRGYLDASLDGWETNQGATLREDLETMRRETIRLQAMIDDLFTIARAEARGLPLNLQPVDLRELVRERVAAMAPLAWHSGRVEILAELPAGLPPALADPIRVDQVLVNLLRNAVRYTPPGGMIAIVAEQEADFLRLDVRDTGRGIPAEDLPRVWERFYRGGDVAATNTAVNGQDPASGAGLGLALVKELTEVMGGSVEAESRPGEGSCFHIRLPINREETPLCDNFATTA